MNADADAGALSAEMLDVSGNPVAPFTKENCIPLAKDATAQEVRWNGAEDLAALADKPVRIRFQLSHGKLFSFWVSPDASGASRGYVAAGGPGFTGPRDM